MVVHKQPQLQPRSPEPPPESKDTHSRLSLQVLEDVFRLKVFQDSIFILFVGSGRMTFLMLSE